MHLPEYASTRSRRMEQLNSRFRAHNVSSNFQPPENVMEYFSLIAPPDSAIGRASPREDEITAPMILTKLNRAFTCCEVTISADFEMDWDQGGLVIFSGGAPRSQQSVASPGRSPYIFVERQLNAQRGKWAKVGLEFTGGELGVSAVVANPNCGADWSFTPAFPLMTPRDALHMAMPSVRVKLERVGSDLWVWYRIPDETPMPLTSRSPEVMSRQWKKCREIHSFFEDEGLKGGVWVGCYASRPMDLEEPTEDDGLYVEFEDLEIL